MKSEIISIYENIYNQELNLKNSIDNKFASRLTMMITIITASIVIFTTVFFPNSDNPEIVYGIKAVLCKVLSLINILLAICIYFSFCKCFFRKKMNYRVMPTVDIRMFHFYIHKNNLCGTDDEEDLYNYLNDSYQFCAYTNAAINAKRERFLIVFDKLSAISFALLIITYIFMVCIGYSIDWIF